ncbi:hypothetical protein Hanom_Chr01g00059741 [Helianthus anomalus]
MKIKKKCISKTPQEYMQYIILDLANGSGRVGSGHGSKRVRVKTGSGQNGSGQIGSVIEKGCFGSGQNGSGSERVRVRKGFGSERVRVRTGFGLGRVVLV